MPPLADLALGFRDDYLDHERLTAQLRVWARAFPSPCRLTSLARQHPHRMASYLVRGTGAIDVRIGSCRAGFVTTRIAV